MASKVRETANSVTGLGLQRTTGTIGPLDHNTLAGLRTLDGQLSRTVVRQGIIAADPARCLVSTTNKRFAVPSPSAPILAIVNGMHVNMGDECEETGSVDSATTTSVIDAGLEAASDDYWKYAWIVFTSGTYAGQARQVDTYTAATNEITWTSALGGIPAGGDTFALTFLYVEDVTSSNTNYLFMTTGPLTAQYGIAAFYANTTGTRVSAYDILLSTVVVGVGGAWSAANDAPTGADRDLYPIIGYFKALTAVSVHGSIAGGAYADDTMTHARLALIGGTSFVSSESGFTITVLEHYKDTEVKVRVTNDNAYAAAPTVIMTRYGTPYVDL